MCYAEPREVCIDLCFCAEISVLEDAQIKLFLFLLVRVEAWRVLSCALWRPAEDLHCVVPNSHFESKEKILWKVFHFHKKQWIFAKYFCVVNPLQLK